MMSTRSYDNTLRRQQADSTHDRILDALCDLLAEGQAATISIPAVARRAQVSVRTVYQHFPNKDVLFDALPEFVNRRVSLPMSDEPDGPLPWPELDAMFRAAVLTLTEHASLLRAMTVAELPISSGDIAAQRARRRFTALGVVMGDALAGLDRRERERLQSLVLGLVSWPTIDRMRADGVATIDEIADTVVWTIRTVVEKARRTHRVTWKASQ